MVSTSMLPVNGTTELSAMPSRTRPGPPSRMSQGQTTTETNDRNHIGWQLEADWRVRGGMRGLNQDSFIRGKVEFRGLRKDATFGSIAIEQLQAIQARGVQVIVDVGGELLEHIVLGNTKLRSPDVCDVIESTRLQTMIARCLKNRGEIDR